MKRRATGSVALLVAFAAWTMSFGAGAAGAEEIRACELVSVHKVATTVGLPHADIVRNHSNLDGTEADEPSMISGVDETWCDLGLWSGAKPKGPKAAAAKARAGQGAEVGVRTWAPNDASINVGEWINSGFDEATAALLKARWGLVYEGTGKVKPLNPKGEGYSGAGATVKMGGIGKGLEAAVGCWWNAQSKQIVCILDQEDQGKPIVHNLNVLADAIVPKFLGAP